MSLPPKVVTIAEGERAIRACAPEAMPAGAVVVSVVVTRDPATFAYGVGITVATPKAPSKLYVMTLDEWERLRK